jgi:KUP system potassium uptake protein
VRVLQKPVCDPADRLTVKRIDDNFSAVELRYGFMEQPDVREDLIRAGGLIPDAKMASFFIGRSSFARSAAAGMPTWQDVLFIAMHRNAADPTDYFNIPPGRVIELGTQFAI